MAKRIKAAYAAHGVEIDVRPTPRSGAYWQFPFDILRFGDAKYEGMSFTDKLKLDYYGWEHKERKKKEVKAWWREMKKIIADRGLSVKPVLTTYLSEKGRTGWRELVAFLNYEEWIRLDDNYLMTKELNGETAYSVPLEKGKSRIVLSKKPTIYKIDDEKVVSLPLDILLERLAYLDKNLLGMINDY